MHATQSPGQALKLKRLDSVATTSKSSMQHAPQGQGQSSSVQHEGDQEDKEISNGENEAEDVSGNEDRGPKVRLLELAHDT